MARKDGGYLGWVGFVLEGGSFKTKHCLCFYTFSP